MMDITCKHGCIIYQMNRFILQKLLINIFKIFNVGA